VSNSGTGNRVMTSPDGINWTIRSSAADNDWRSVCYGNGLFVAVSTTGTGNRVMTSGKQKLDDLRHDNIHQGFHIFTNIIQINGNSIYDSGGAAVLQFDGASHLLIPTIKSGATQAAAGAAANEVWKTAGHASLPNNILMIGV